MIETLITSLLTAVAGLIADAVTGGDTQHARVKLKYFIALAKAARDDDRSKAEAILRARFTPSTPQEEEDMYDSLDD